MSEVLENKSKKKNDLSKEDGKVKKVNSSKSEELNKEKSKTGNKTSNKTQSVEKVKEKKNVTVKENAKKNVKESTKQTPTEKIPTDKAKKDETSNSKVSTNKTKQNQKTNLNAKNEKDTSKNVEKKQKNESTSTKNKQQKNNTNQKNIATKKDTASKENSKKNVDEKEKLKNQKSKSGTTKKQKEKTETNNLPAPESKFDTVSLKEIREALQNKVNDNQKQKVVKKVLINIGFAITMIVYLIIVALATKNIELSVLEKDLKIITLGILVSGILVLERAYKKDNTQMAINAVEILIFGAINLCMIYAIKINLIKLGDIKDIINNIAYMSGGVAIYYMLKSIIISVKNVRKFKKENNDIKEIIKK